MKFKQLFVALTAAIFILAVGGKRGRDHKGYGCYGLRERQVGREGARERTQAGRRCDALRPRSRRSAEPTISQDCLGNYEYMPDASWKGTGTCTDNYPEGKISLSWEEGSHLKECTYTKTGGTGKYQGVKGGGTYMYQNLLRHPFRRQIQRPAGDALKSRWQIDGNDDLPCKVRLSKQVRMQSC